jgi:Dihydrodipicolinate synthetase family
MENPRMTDLLSGVVPVVPTIFHDDETVDLDGTARVVDYLIDGGVDGLCVLANYSEQFSLTDAERDAIARTLLDGRLPTLVWPRQIPIAGEPADVHQACAAYAAWLAAAPGLPKLFVNAEPGSILTGAVRDFCRTWPDQAKVTVPGIHFTQEDSGAEIGHAVATWLRQLPAEPGNG